MGLLIWSTISSQTLGLATEESSAGYRYTWRVIRCEVGDVGIASRCYGLNDAVVPTQVIP